MDAITLQYGSVQTPEFKPEVTGNTVRLESGMDGRNGIESARNHPNAMTDESMTAFHNLMNQNFILRACQHMWVPKSEGVGETEEERGGAADKAYMKWQESNFSGDMLQPVLQNRNNMKVYLGGVGKVVGQLSQIQEELKNSYKSEECQAIGNRVMRHETAKASNSLRIKPKGGNMDMELTTETLIQLFKNVATQLYRCHEMSVQTGANAVTFGKAFQQQLDMVETWRQIKNWQDLRAWTSSLEALASNAVPITLVPSVPRAWFMEAFKRPMIKMDEEKSEPLRLYSINIETKVYPITLKKPEFNPKGWEIMSNATGDCFEWLKLGSCARHAKGHCK